MKTFTDAFNVVVGIEGGYWLDPVGGATKFGTTEKVARAWGYQGSMQDLPIETAQAIAKSLYWDKFQCDQFDPRIGLCVFDAAYNGGHPIVWLQQVVGVEADGIVGAHTIAAVRNQDVYKTVALFQASHQDYMTDLNNWVPNARGWAKRVANILRVAASN